MIQEGVISIPTWQNGNWVTTEFGSRNEFKEFLIPFFKEPGKYEFDDTSLIFNEQANFFRENKFFNDSPKGSKDFLTYWNEHKTRCRTGVLFQSNGKSWFLPREYYMWLNFLPIKNKETSKFDFPDVRDAQYHLALYELLAELHYKHCAITKKRQIASSYYHAAKMLNQIWFEEGVVLQIGAKVSDYVKKTWNFLNEYKDFLNKNTAWTRDFNPGTYPEWKQLDKQKVNGRWVESGLKGVLRGTSFEKSETSGVGGETSYFFYEEGGIAPTMDKTFEFLRPAMQSGFITTGMFIAAGSVGELDECQPLRTMTLYPEANDIYPVVSNLIDDKGTYGKTALFIPEQWSMKPFIDQYGNSLVEEALEAIKEERKIWKKNLTPEKYQLRISQHPTNIEEAFKNRKESKFPTHLISAQRRRIEDKDYSIEYVDIYKDEHGKIGVRESKKIPIREFPIMTNEVDKTGVLVIHERPIKDSKFGLYYASVDPVGEGKTTTSESLCSIYVYKNPREIERNNGGELETFIEQDKIVAWWCGRHDDIKRTHQMLELIIEYYNAWTVVENNIPSFITYMIDRNKQKYLVPKSQMLFLKDLHANNSVFQEYGWRNTGVLFKTHLLNYLIEWLSEELNVEEYAKGIERIVYGIERLPDIMAMVEMDAYTEGLNVDRLVSLSALVAFAKVQQANRAMLKFKENISVENSNKITKFGKSMFRNIGKPSIVGGRRNFRSPFNNIR
jgi:hypothetical protein